MSDKKTTYREHTDMENTLKLRQVLATLPPFCKDYFRAIDTTTTAKTRISYAYDIRIFFHICMFTVSCFFIAHKIKFPLQYKRNYKNYKNGFTKGLIIAFIERALLIYKKNSGLSYRYR